MISRFDCPRCGSDDVQVLPHARPHGAARVSTLSGPITAASQPFDWNAAPDTRDTRPERGSVRFCGSCGQTTIGAPCSCATPAEPIYETLRLFTPAPTPMRGQTTIEGT